MPPESSRERFGGLFGVFADMVDKGWRLAPVYDLTYSDTYWGEHTTSVNGRGKDITKEDLVKVGVGAGLPEGFCEESIDEIGEKTKALAKYFKKSKVKRGDMLSFSERLEDFMQ